MPPARAMRIAMATVVCLVLPCAAVAEYRPSRDSAAEAASAIALWPGVAPGSETVGVAQSPPTFLLHAADDASVPVENSLVFHAGLRRAGVDAALHVFPHGGHGFGTRDAHGLLAVWPRLALQWLRSAPTKPVTQKRNR